MIFYLENLSSNGKISSSCSPCCSLTRNKGLCEALSPGTVISILACRLPSPASLLLPVPLDPAQPSSPHCQPGCSSCISGLSLGNSALFNYLASDGSDFSLFSWQPSRTHPSFSFSQRRFGAATAEDQPKAAHGRAGMRGEASSSLQEQPSTEAGHQSRRDVRTDINRASPALQEKKEEITEVSEIRKRKKHRNLKKEEGFNFSRYTGTCRDCSGANSVCSAHTGSVQCQVGKWP